MADEGPPTPATRRREPPEGTGPEWRVEGAPKPPPAAPERRSRFPRMPGGARFWWILLGLLALNYFVVSLIPSKDERLSVPYTLFREQVEAGNVSEVTSKGDTIQGEFKKEVTY